MKFIVVLQSDDAATALPEVHDARITADARATDALKAHEHIWDAKKSQNVPARKALVCQVVAEAVANVTLAESK